MDRIAASIVLYNPDLIRLKENIIAIYNQVEELVLIDNSSINIDLIESEYRDYENITIIKNESNLGIARALNQGMIFCESKGYKWVLTLDQDSVCPSNIIEEYLKYIKIPMVAIVSPIIADRNKPESFIEKNYINSYELIDKCITSAALTNISIWKEIDGFDELMFIDLVDFEFCKRVLLNGYKIIRINNLVLLHEIGHITQRRIFHLKVDVKNHSAFRKYYMARNIIYYSKKYRSYGSVISAYLRVLKLFILMMLYEKHKINKASAILKGVKDGRRLYV